MNHFIKEIKDSFRFFRKHPQGEKRIVFYSEGNAFYSYFEGLIDELMNIYGEDIHYITSDIHDPVLKRKDSQFYVYYINKLLPFFMLFVKCKVFVATLNDLHQMHIKKSLNSKVHYVYVPHTLASTHMVFRFGALDYYDSILCAGAHHLDEIKKTEKIYDLNPKRLIKAGYYRLERIFAENSQNKQSRESNHKTILIAPSYGRGNIIKVCGQDLIKSLLDGGYRVIVRPHPEIIKNTPEIIRDLSLRFTDNPNFSFDTKISSYEKILEADVLISDYSGIAMEYAFGTERPVLFIDVPLKINNPRYLDIGMEPVEVAVRSKIGEVLQMSEIHSVTVFVSKLIAEKEKYIKNIVELRNKYIYNFGQSSLIGAKHIMDIVNTT